MRQLLSSLAGMTLRASSASGLEMKSDAASTSAAAQADERHARRHLSEDDDARYHRQRDDAASADIRGHCAAGGRPWPSLLHGAHSRRGTEGARMGERYR